jgi:hypothetical protein
MSVQVSPIAESDLPRVAEFLSAEFPYGPRETAETWERALHTPWRAQRPNWGFMAHDGDSIVGAYIAQYSEQEVDGAQERFCNLGVWHVLPEHRMHSIRMLRSLLGQEGYHFTDLSPAENVVAINERLGFETLDTRGVVVPCLPWPTLPGRARVTSDPEALEEVLSDRDLDLYRDHLGATGLRHVAIVAGGSRCYVVLRPDNRRRRLPALTVLHASRPELLCLHARRFGRHLLFHHRVAAYVAEQRLIHCRPRPSLVDSAPPTRMFRSDRLQADGIGYLYTELASPLK